MNRDRIALIVFVPGFLLYLLGFLLSASAPLLVLGLLVMISALAVYDRKFLEVALVLGLVIILYLPALSWLLSSWHHNEYYQHGFLIPLVSGFFAWQNRDKLMTRERSQAGIVLLIPGLLLYIFGIFFETPLLIALSLIVVLGALTVYFYGGRTLRTMAFPLGFLLFMIPPPFLDSLTYDMQMMAVRSSASIVRALGIEVTVTGAEIRLGESSFAVGLPCSGMRSLVSSLAIASVLVYIVKGSPIRRTILLLSAIPIAILTNILRIVAILLIGYHYSADTARNFHDPLGLVAFVLVVVLLIAESLLLRLKLVEDTPNSTGG